VESATTIRPPTATRSNSFEGYWSELAALALRGLQATYLNSENSLPHSMRWNGSIATPVGNNPRYALISLLGLAQANFLADESQSLVTYLWKKVTKIAGTWNWSPGDIGLGLWASVLGKRGDSGFTVERARQSLAAHGAKSDSVELAWILLGTSHAFAAGIEVNKASETASNAFSLLRKLFNPDVALFYRHGNPGLLRSVSRRVPCFANQIYPVMALACYATTTKNAEAMRISTSCADNLCALQGRLGQWWWLYDAAQGGVVDGYPVFSVHQDGMAPMALRELERAGGRNYSAEIEKSLSWIYGGNELGESLVLESEGIVLRDIHRRGVGRTRRALAAATCCMGKKPTTARATSGRNFVVNHECRPYHLGWNLYAAGTQRRFTPAGES